MNSRRLLVATENWQKWCGRDVARQSVLGTSIGNRKARLLTGDSHVSQRDVDDVDEVRSWRRLVSTLSVEPLELV